MIARTALFGAAGAAVLAASLITASVAEAACTRHPHVGRASGLLRTTTAIAARADWRREVRNHDGPEFTRWGRAKAKFTRCRRPEGGRWHCTARAYACNS